LPESAAEGFWKVSAKAGARSSVHPGQYFLHALNRAGSLSHQIASLPPQRACHADLIGRLKAVVQQAKCVQLQQPLTFLDISLAARQVLCVAGVNRKYFIQSTPVDCKATLRTPFCADFAMLSDDITTIPAAAILKTHVTMTVTGGKIVWRE